MKFWWKCLKSVSSGVAAQRTELDSFRFHSAVLVLFWVVLSLVRSWGPFWEKQRWKKLLIHPVYHSIEVEYPSVSPFSHISCQRLFCWTVEGKIKKKQMFHLYNNLWAPSDHMHVSQHISVSWRVNSAELVGEHILPLSSAHVLEVWTQRHADTESVVVPTCCVERWHSVYCPEPHFTDRMLKMTHFIALTHTRTHAQTKWEQHGSRFCSRGQWCDCEVKCDFIRPSASFVFLWACCGVDSEHIGPLTDGLTVVAAAQTKLCLV